MTPDFPFEAVLQLLTMAYFASLMLLLAASSVGLAVIEALEKAGD